MRVANLIVTVSIAALTALAPALAKQSQLQKPAENETSSTPCHAYQMAPDGSWTQASCQEAGAAGQPRRKSATRGSTDNVTR